MKQTRWEPGRQRPASHPPRDFLAVWQLGTGALLTVKHYVKFRMFFSNQRGKYGRKSHSTENLVLHCKLALYAVVEPSRCVILKIKFFVRALDFISLPYESHGLFP